MFKTMLRKLARDVRGATAIEYGLIVALIAITCIAAFKTMGNSQAMGIGGVANKVSDVLSANN